MSNECRTGRSAFDGLNLSPVKVVVSGASCLIAQYCIIDWLAYKTVVCSCWVGRHTFLPSVLPARSSVNKPVPLWTARCSMSRRL